MLGGKKYKRYERREGEYGTVTDWIKSLRNEKRRKYIQKRKKGE